MLYKILYNISFPSSIHLFGCLISQSQGCHLGLVVHSIFGLAFLFQSLNNRFVFPSSFVGQTSDLTIFASWFQLQDTECRGNNHSLLSVIRVGDAIEDLQSVESLHSSLGFVRNHSSDHLEETLARSTEVVRSLGWFGVHSLSQILQHLEFVSVEVTRDANTLASYNHDALTTKDLLCNDGCKTTHEVA